MGHFYPDTPLQEAEQRVRSISSGSYPLERILGPSSPLKMELDRSYGSYDVRYSRGMGISIIRNAPHTLVDDMVRENVFFLINIQNKYSKNRLFRFCPSP